MTPTSTIFNGNKAPVVVWLAGLLSFALTAIGHAQTPQNASAWYQVEVIIFERMYGGQGGDREVWPKDVDLHYPEHWQKLMTPEQAAELHRNPPVAEPSAPGEPSPAAPQVPFLTINNSERPTYDDLELAFVLLPKAERTLNESAGGISRARDMRLLFHEAWRQPMLAADEGPSIIIQGGNSYGEHTELEGSIHLSLSRYLHIYTNLWLTQFVPNYGQQSEHWPALPALPERRPAETPLQDEEPLPLGFSTERSAWDIEPATADDYTNLINQPYLVKEIVTLHQTRRMRSGELHYIDHPRMGLLIKIDGFDPNKD